MPGGWTGTSATDRKETLPPDWARRRSACIDRAGGRCERIVHPPKGGRFRCPRPATDADHRGDRLDDDDLEALCSRHHGQKTSRQGQVAKAAKKQAARRDRGADGPHRS